MKKKVLPNVEAQLKDLTFAVEELTLMVEALQEALEASPRVVYIPSQPIIIERPVHPHWIPYSGPVWQNPYTVLCTTGSAALNLINEGGLNG